jgi:hypothetical protein
LISSYKPVLRHDSRLPCKTAPATADMCIYLFYQLRKWRRNHNAPRVPAGREQRRNTKQRPLCEHQLADAARVKDDGALSGTSPGLDHRQANVEERGSEPCPECTAEKKRAKMYRWKVILSLLIPNIMASMDLTIIATALPTIASHFCKRRQHVSQILPAH